MQRVDGSAQVPYPGAHQFGIFFMNIPGRPILGRPFCLEAKRYMNCESCAWNKNKLTGVPFCIFPKCIYEKRGDDGDRKTEKVLRPIHKTG